MQLARRSQNTLTPWTHFQKGSHQSCSLAEEPRTHSLPGHIFERSLISYAVCQKKQEHTHILDTFQKEPHQPCSLPEEARTHSQPGHVSEGASSAMQLARSKNTLTTWTRFQKETHQPCSLLEETRTHSQPGHIFRRSLISHAAWQKKPEHTHSLDTFSERASSAMQLARRSKNTLTIWTHFQESHQPCSLPEEARTHSLPGHIFRRGQISHAACQKKPGHTHSLDTFSEGASAMQLARRSQNTLTLWTHFQKEPHQLCSLPEEARTHSQPGHIFRSLLSHAACQKNPEHTHSLDTFSGALSACSLPEEARTHSHPGHIFRRSLISYAACQKKPEHTHNLDTFSGASSAMQLARRSKNALTSWTHFQKEPHQPCSLPEEARTHSQPGHIFRRSQISHAACQKKPEHTHILDTFSEEALSAMQLGRRSKNTLTLWTHFQKKSHQPCSLPEATLTLWTHFQKEPHQPCSLPEEARTHSLSGHIFR